MIGLIKALSWKFVKAKLRAVWGLSKGSSGLVHVGTFTVRESGGTDETQIVCGQSGGGGSTFIVNVDTGGTVRLCIGSTGNALLTVSGSTSVFANQVVANGASNSFTINSDASLFRRAAGDLAACGNSATSAGALSVNGGNGSYCRLQSVSESITIGTGATTDSAADLLPADAFVVGVTYRVTVQPPGTSSFQLGDASSADKFADAGTASTAGTTGSNLTKATAQAPFAQSAAAKVRVTPNTAPSDNTGRIRVTTFYYDLTPPTS